MGTFRKSFFLKEKEKQFTNVDEQKRRNSGCTKIWALEKETKKRNENMNDIQSKDPNDEILEIPHGETIRIFELTISARTAWKHWKLFPWCWTNFSPRLELKTVQFLALKHNLKHAEEGSPSPFDQVRLNILQRVAFELNFFLYFYQEWTTLLIYYGLMCQIVYFNFFNKDFVAMVGKQTTFL